MQLNYEQQGAIDRLYENDASLLIAGCGVGKTVVTLTAISELIAGGELKRVLVVAPAKVVSGWVDEALKWSQLASLRVIGGTGKDSIAFMLNSDAHVIVTSYDSVKALLSLDVDFDGVVFDEITRLKSSGGSAFRALRGKLKSWWRVGLSATPLSENWQAVYGMTMMLDGGRIFGRRKDLFLNAYFNINPYQKYDITLKANAEALIVERMSGLVHIMEGNQFEVNHLIDVIDGLPDSLVSLQSELAKESYAQVSGADVVIANPAVLSGKYRQIAQGFVHDEEGSAVMLWSGRFDYLESILEGPTVIAYEFALCGDEFRRRFPSADVIDGATSKTEFDSIMRRWRAGAGERLFLQVQAGSHGLDGLQNSASSLIFFAPIWSNDRTIQTIGRLARTGQTEEVNVRTICVSGTIDEMVVDRVESKKKIFRDFLSHLN